MFLSAAVCLFLKNTDLFAVEKYNVVDGDSLRFEKVEIRLIDIDAPEFFQKCYNKNNEQYECGKIATRVLENYVKNGIQCRGKEKDVYNRILMECFDNDGNSINKKMIFDGWAVTYSDRF